MYPRMRPGLVLAQVNGEDVIYLDFDSIMNMVEEAEQPRHFMFIIRESKWNIVRRKLHFIATTMRQQGDGTTKAEREWRLQVHTNILFYATKGNLKNLIIGWHKSRTLIFKMKQEQLPHALCLYIRHEKNR